MLLPMVKKGVKSEYTNLDDTKKGSTLDRRTYLKMAGAAAAVAAAGAGQSSAASTKSYGYGEGGYGNGPYGGMSSFSVHTKGGSSVGSTSATLEGSLEELEGAESAACAFEWRKSGASSWNTTSNQQLTALGTYSTDINGLEDGTAYEYRAIGVASDGDSDVGITSEFTTEINNQGPTVEGYSVTEAGSSDAHIKITASWSVADPDGNLDTVVVEAKDATGSLSDISATNVNGSAASGASTLDVRHVNGQTFDVTVTVIDTYGQDSSQIKSVTE